MTYTYKLLFGILVGLFIFSVLISLPRSPKAIAASPAVSTVAGLNVYVGYAEDKEFNVPNAALFPVPWQGSANTIFLGNPVTGTTNCGSLSNCFDAGAIRLDNPGSTDITVTNVTVDDHSSMTGGKTFNLWGSFTVPAGKTVILTQNPPGNNPSTINFDTSSFPKNTDCSNPITVAPTVTFLINGVSTTLVDSTHVLDTGGVDQGSCTTGAGNESFQWRAIGTTGNRTATLTLSPSSSNPATGSQVTETANLIDGSGNGLPNVAVNFYVFSGPNTGLTGGGTTDANGIATFRYTGNANGTDNVIASVTSVGTFSSNIVNVTWGNSTTPPPPVGLSSLHVFDTANASKWSVQSNIQVGNNMYGDRTYTIASIPSFLLGSSWIQTANGSKTFTGNPLVTFTTDEQSVIYVAFDAKLPIPSWVDNTWANYGLQLTNNQSGTINTFNMYSKIFPAGTISLGANDNGSTSFNMYTVIVQPDPSSSPTPTPTPTLTPTPTPTLTPTPTPTSGPVQLSNLSVFDTTNAANWSLQTNLQTGNVQYGDRSYTFSIIPSSLLGSSWVKTANASRSFTGTPVVTFSINQTATVYVALDTRVTPLPSFIDNTWTNTGLTLTDNQAVGHNTFALYSKVFSSGAVSLGSNDNGSTSVNMYTVIVQ